jgi:hypothetical protein
MVILSALLWLIRTDASVPTLRTALWGAEGLDSLRKACVPRNNPA